MLDDHELRRPELTISDAAKACGVARITIRRRLDDDQFPGAHRVNGMKGPGTGPWVIPVEDLIAAGLSPNAYVNETPDEPDGRGVEDRLRDDLSRARDEITRLRHEKDLAVAVADERDRSLADLRSAMRMIEAPKPVIVEVPRRAWFRRRPKPNLELMTPAAPTENTEAV